MDGLVSELKDFFGEETSAEFTNWLLHYVEEMASGAGAADMDTSEEAAGQQAPASSAQADGKPGARSFRASAGRG